MMRPAPLWSWNDKLEPDELRRQVREIARQGWGGFYMHPRVGFTTHYLSDTWMEAVHACIDEAQKQGISAWLYDEDRWPSGFGAGVVAELDPAYRTRALVIRPRGSEKRYDTVMQEVDVAGRPHVICEQVSESGREWYNGSTYVDLMNPNAVRAFLDAVVERYRAACGEHFGKTIPGVFTDEPLYLENSAFDSLAVPWSTCLPDFFQKLHGYDIRHHLPKLFLERDDYRRVRFDFYKAASQLFCQSFTKQYFQWCQENNLLFTGHFQAEENLRLQLQWTGDVMAHYPWMHWPGVDKLERHLHQPLMIKQLSSVTDQLQKERAFCEAFGISGTQVSFFHRKWVSDWLVALGINFINVHLSLYSMRGMRKRDCPPNLFFQQPWWEDEKGFADYEARLCAAMIEGKRRVDVLLLQPLASAWCEYTPMDWDSRYAAVEVYDGPYQEMGQQLLAHQIDYHVGNEAIMADHARVEGDRFYIGQHGYQIVLLSPTLNLHSHTEKLLRAFLENGGQVVITGKPPAFVDGIATTLNLPGVQYATRVLEAIRLVKQLAPRYVEAIDLATGATARDVFIHSRDLAGGARHLLVNTAEYREVRIAIQLPPADRPNVAMLDLADGTIFPVTLDAQGRIEVTLAPAGSVVLLTGDQAREVTSQNPSTLLGSGACVGEPPQGEPVAVIEQFDVELLEENILRVDDVTLELEGRQVYEGPVIGVWKPHFYAAADGTSFRATYHFESACELENCVAIIDSAEHLERIEFNGQAVQPLRKAGDPQLLDPASSWKDIAYTRVPLTTVKRGRNTLVLEGRKLNVAKPSGVSHSRTKPGDEPRETQLEDVLIAGRFRLQTVSPGQFILAAYAAPQGGNMSQNGFPFYSGRTVYRAAVDVPSLPSNKKCWLQLNDLQAASARVRVNGQLLATLRWAPHVVDLSHHLKAGKNQIEIELATTLNNVFGPVRLAEALDKRRVVPRNFDDMTRYQKRHDLMPFGLGSATIVAESR